MPGISCIRPWAPAGLTALGVVAGLLLRDGGEQRRADAVLRAPAWLNRSAYGAPETWPPATRAPETWPAPRRRRRAGSGGCGRAWTGRRRSARSGRCAAPRSSCRCRRRSRCGRRRCCGWSCPTRAGRRAGPAPGSRPAVPWRGLVGGQPGQVEAELLEDLLDQARAVDARLWGRCRPRRRGRRGTSWPRRRRPVAGDGAARCRRASPSVERLGERGRRWRALRAEEALDRREQRQLGLDLLDPGGDVGDAHETTSGAAGDATAGWRPRPELVGLGRGRCSAWACGCGAPGAARRRGADAGPAASARGRRRRRLRRRLERGRAASSTAWPSASSAVRAAATNSPAS